VFVKIVEIHDFSPTDDSSDDSSSSGDGFVGDGLPRPLLSTSLQLWPRVYRLGSASSSNGVPWPSLPEHGRDVIWFVEVGQGCKKQTPSTKVCHVKAASHVQSPHRHVASTDGSTKPAPLGGVEKSRWPAALRPCAAGRTTSKPNHHLTLSAVLDRG
jgi:hypothetical protein